MSLAEAVLEIVDEMEHYKITDFGSKSIYILLLGYAKQLRRAVKASSASEELIGGNLKLRDTVQKDLEQMTKRNEERLKQRGLEKLDENSPCLRFCEGGLADKIAVPVDASMPVGAKTLLMNQVYVLEKDGILRHLDSLVLK